MFSHEKDVFMCFVISVFLLILAPIDQVYGSPGGAPTAACGTMTPGHGAPVQTSLAPFMTEMPNGNFVEMDKAVRLELRSPNENPMFKGFLVMAFRANGTTNEPIGSFRMPSDGQVINCLSGNQNAATHNNNNGKKLVTVTWTPPAGYMGDVVFRTTYVRDFNTYWVKTESKVLTVGHHSPAAPTVAPTAAPTAAPAFPTSAPTRGSETRSPMMTSTAKTISTTPGNGAASPSSVFWAAVTMIPLTLLMRY